MLHRLNDQPPSGRPPVILLAGGDPAGVGPEIVAAAWAAADHERVRLRIVGEARILRAVFDRRGVAHPAARTIRIDDPRPSRPDELLVIEPEAPAGDGAAIPDARITAAGGRKAADR